MKSQIRFIIVVFFITAILIFTVHLRSEENQMFYELCNIRAEESKLKQELWQNQLKRERLVNPVGVSERFKE